MKIAAVGVWNFPKLRMILREESFIWQAKGSRSFKVVAKRVALQPLPLRTAREPTRRVGYRGCSPIEAGEKGGHMAFEGNTLAREGKK